MRVDAGRFILAVAKITALTNHSTNGVALHPILAPITERIKAWAN